MMQEISKLAQGPGSLESFQSEVCDITALVDLDTRTFIDAVYRALLLRDAHAAEKERYLASLENRSLSRRQFVDALLTSEEFHQLGRPLRVLHGDDLLSLEPSSGGATPPLSGDPRSGLRP